MSKLSDFCKDQAGLKYSLDPPTYAKNRVSTVFFYVFTQNLTLRRSVGPCVKHGVATFTLRAPAEDVEKRLSLNHSDRERAPNSHFWGKLHY